MSLMSPDVPGDRMIVLSNSAVPGEKADMLMGLVSVTCLIAVTKTNKSNIKRKKKFLVAQAVNFKVLRFS